MNRRSANLALAVLGAFFLSSCQAPPDPARPVEPSPAPRASIALSSEARATLDAFRRNSSALDAGRAFTLTAASQWSVAGWEIDRRRQELSRSVATISSARLDALLRPVYYTRDTVVRKGDALAADHVDEGGQSAFASFAGADTVVVQNAPGNLRQALIAPGPVKIYDSFELMDFYFPASTHFWDRARARVVFRARPPGIFVPKSIEELERALEPEFHYAGAETLSGTVRCHVFYVRSFPRLWPSRIWLQAHSGSLRKIRFFHTRRDARDLPVHLDADGRLRFRNVRELEGLTAACADVFREITFEDHRPFGAVSLPRKSTGRVYELRRSAAQTLRVAVTRDRLLTEASFEDADVELPPPAKIFPGVMVIDWRHDPPLEYPFGEKSLHQWENILRRSLTKAPTVTADTGRREALVGRTMPPIEAGRWIGPEGKPDFTGKRRLILFTGAAFPPGKAVLAALRAALPRLRARNVLPVVVLRATDLPSQAAEALADLLPDAAVAIDSPHDDAVWRSATFYSYSVISIPYAFLADADGTIRAHGELSAVLGKALGGARARISHGGLAEYRSNARTGIASSRGPATRNPTYSPSRR